MLSPTGWWLVTAPVNLRGGMDRLWLHVRGHLQQDPVHGGAYVFRNRAGTRIKVLHVVPTACGWRYDVCTRGASTGPAAVMRPGRWIGVSSSG